MLLSDSAAQVLNLLVTGERLARPELSRRLGVTPPTVATALVELQKAGLAVQTGSAKGPLGRTALVYGMSQRAGWILGIDLGSTQAAIVAQDLCAGSVQVHQRSVAVPADAAPGPSPEVVEEVGTAVEAMIAAHTAGRGPLLAVGIAVPQVVPNNLSEETFISWDGEPVQVGALLRSLRLPADVPVLLENNANCAALGEFSHGVARGVRNFAFLQIGVRVGAGLVVDGKLHRGAHGAGGEVALLPFPFPAGAEDSRIDLELERYLGSDAFVSRAADAWTGERIAAPADAKELFALSGSGHELSRRLVGRHAADVARLALALAAVLDPQLIVLGGGVGQNPELVSRVRALVNGVRPELDVDPALLGELGTAEGAAVLATEHARRQLLGRWYSAVIPSDSASVRQVSSPGLGHLR